MSLRAGRLLSASSTVFAVLISLSTAQLPYGPTRILASTQNATLAYIFRPASGHQFELASTELDSDLGQNLEAHVLYASLPFLDEDDARSFVPSLDAKGNIIVYAGKCSEGAAGAELWTFAPEPSSPFGNGTWAKEAIDASASSSDNQLDGANYLASGLSFSSVVDGPQAFYSFGGMCPLDDGTESPSTWQNSADYSNLLLAFTPGAADATDTTFALQSTSTGNKPISEAGFTVTGLGPSYANSSDGSQSQQQSFVMIGGHTQAAFINMSQVALFSLPQGAWNFLPIDPPSGDHTDLTRRSGDSVVEPRSGHSAVLSADGTQIVVFGGWIGDISNAASPALAVLNVGEGYGGAGSWTWMIPEATGQQPQALLGHDALMLPGGVMMVTGGYTIQSSSSKFRARASAALSPNSNTHYLNVSSGSWISSYSPPQESATTSPSSAAEHSSGALSSTGQKIGLAVGLSVGAAVLLALFAFYLWYRRRLRLKREAREEEIRKLSYGANRLTSDDPRNYYDDDSGQEKGAHVLSEQSTQQGWRSASGHNVERTGLLVEIPSPTRGLRRGVATRNGYQPAPRYDEKRLSRASGNIPPIEESDEEHITGGVMAHSRHQKQQSAASALSNASTLDPFLDMNPLGSHPTGYSPTDVFGQNRHPAHQIVAHGRYAEHKEMEGRASPSKSDRTSSTLSDQSARSGMSARSTQLSTTLVGSLARSLSIRSAHLLNVVGLGATVVNPFQSPDASPTHERRGHFDDDDDDDDVQPSAIAAAADEPDRPRTKDSQKTGSSHDAQSFYSARSGGFDKLKAESEV
ncbi:MAG: hypothetical protein INR71_02555, partial [Terriglobus roseus]|nr:hypothetical protein [Terriglobus roseus]